MSLYGTALMPTCLALIIQSTFVRVQFPVRSQAPPCSCYFLRFQLVKHPSLQLVSSIASRPYMLRALSSDGARCSPCSPQPSFPLTAQQSSVSIDPRHLRSKHCSYLISIADSFRCFNCHNLAPRDDPFAVDHDITDV